MRISAIARFSLLCPLLGCGNPASRLPSALDVGAVIELAEPRSSTSLDRWTEAARNALTQPIPVKLPHAERGVVITQEVAAIGYFFEAVAGQVLEVDFAQWLPGPVEDSTAGELAPSPVYVDVLFVDVAATVARYRPVRGLAIEGSSLRAPISSSGYHVLRLQPEPFADLVYGITLQLRSALPFPVRGQDMAAVQSFFGDPRDLGARRHEGIDIFAARGTPVVAVSDGRAVPGRNNLGGNIVWLNTAGVSYYYAHLDRTAIARPRRVKAGDVIGYIGNTGNAASTPPHLHFAIYRWGRGAIDPLPQFVERSFEAEAPPIDDPAILVAADDELPARAGEPNPAGVTIVPPPSSSLGSTDVVAPDLLLDVGAQIVAAPLTRGTFGGTDAAFVRALPGASAAGAAPAIVVRKLGRARLKSPLVSRETLYRFAEPSAALRKRAGTSLALAPGSTDLEGNLR